LYVGFNADRLKVARRGGGRSSIAGSAVLVAARCSASPAMAALFSVTFRSRDIRRQ